MDLAFGKYETAYNRAMEESQGVLKNYKAINDKYLKREQEKRDKIENERREKERLENERKEKERLEKERLEHERQEKLRLEAERLEKQRLEKERLEKEAKEKKEREEKERLDRERLEQEAKDKTEKDQRAKAESDRKEKEAKEKKKSESDVAGIAPLKKLYMASDATLTEYTKRQRVLQQVEDEVAKQGTNETMKEVKKNVNRIINQISSDSSVVMEKAGELQQLLHQSTLAGKPLYNYTMMAIVHKVTNQVASQIAFHLDAVHPYAQTFSLVISGGHPELLELLLAQINRTCIYTVPMYVIKRDNDEGYHSRMGYIKAQDGIQESEDVYHQRMSAYVSFYAALMIRPELQQHHGIDCAWRLCARILNLKPKRVTSFLLVALLNVAGVNLIETYGSQFSKLLTAMSTPAFFDKIPDQGIEASKARLKLLLEQYFTNMRTRS
eukprot:gene8371-9838_t